MAIQTSGITVIPARRTVEGGGFVVHRPFPVPELAFVDPFLLIDEMGPVDYAPGAAIGAPDHPHRGFETVTYLLDGAMQHEDSYGHRGELRSGDVQWMTAGAGVIHSEMPAPDIVANGGRMHGFQIWVNLPRDRKMTTPRYQEYTRDQLPVAEADGVWVRVIAGEVDGRRSPIETTVPTTLLHVRLAPGTKRSFTVPAGANTIVHTIAGDGSVADVPLRIHDVAVIEASSGSVPIAAGGETLDVLLLAGMPLREPVARYGPFVMNTREEIVQAVDDFRSGRFGEIART